MHYISRVSQSPLKCLHSLMPRGFLCCWTYADVEIWNFKFPVTENCSCRSGAFRNWNYDLQVITSLFKKCRALTIRRYVCCLLKKLGPFVISLYLYFDTDEFHNNPKACFLNCRLYTESFVSVDKLRVPFFSGTWWTLSVIIAALFLWVTAVIGLLIMSVNFTCKMQLCVVQYYAKLNCLLSKKEKKSFVFGNWRFWSLSVHHWELLMKQHREGDVFVELVMRRTEICDLHFTVDNCLYACVKC